MSSSEQKEKAMPQRVVLAGAVRTAIGKYQGGLAGMPAPDLGAVTIREALARAGVSAEAVDEVLFGCVVQAGLGQNVARQSARQAGLPDEVPATTVNTVCGSGLRAVGLAAALVLSGEADVVVAGGTESMSRAPYLLEQARSGYRLGDGTLVDALQRDGLSDAFASYAMGITAENLAERYGITRSEQDEFALESQRRCARAQAEARFASEIVPVSVPGKRGPVAVDVDEPPRPNSTIEALAALKPVFKAGGTVTAGNSSSLADGAAALVVLSEERARELGVTPMATLVATASAGVDPAYMGHGPVESTRKLLHRTGLTIQDLDLIELNEAFAVQAIHVERDLGLDRDRVNVLGGAIALGHPIGCSGTRILVTLLHEMHRREVEHGLAALCVGGGMGVSALVRRWEP